MARQVTFPVVSLAGATATKIYRSPLKAPPSKPIDGSTSDIMESKSYDSYMVSYYPDFRYSAWRSA